MSWQTILAIGSGGFVGAILRAYIASSIPKITNFPLATLSVNLLGSFIIGSLFAYFSYTQSFSVSTKSFLTTGFLGALTTYSTFAFESFLLFQGNHYALAFSSILSNTLGSIILAGIGFKLIHSLMQ
jgi:CrcB protein